MHHDRELLCFSAMSGVFAGHADLDQLWTSIVQARPAPLTDLPARWGMAREGFVDPTPGTRNRSYLDRAFCLDLPPAPADAPGAWRQQRDLTVRVCEQLWTRRPEHVPPPRQDTAMVWGTSWSDESLFRADSALALHQPVRSDWLGPDTQLDEVADALQLDGPRLSVDTACSSFPYALATAHALIRSGQARRAVVAGVNVFLPPQLFLGFSQLRALSADARLQAFSRDANGIVPGEGVAAFLIEPLEEALHAGRRPLGLLRALGISSDGSEGSVFAPGHRAQLTAYERAYEGLDPASICYVEAHGTGTPVGDLTELRSLDDFFHPHRPAGAPRLPLGSIKPLVGHTLAAAGAASLAKVLLMLRHRTLPPHIDVAPHARLAESCFTLPTAASPLPEDSAPARIGLSSFGFGGANAHAVIEDARHLAAPAPRVAVHGATPLSRPSPVQALDLDIVDLDASLAIGAHASQWASALQAPVPPATQPFPASRAGEALPEAGPPLHGHFFAGDCAVDIAGWRVGPKPLAHVDPFKLLITHRTRRLLDRLPGWAGSPDTAIVVCANLGGERFLSGYRACAAHYEAGQPTTPELVVDDVATMLPTMLSGYPAQVLDLRGFHQTLSGPNDSFWQTLLSAPAWLGSHCRQLVLGAGHYLNAPIEAQRAATARWTWGEGYGVLALRRHLPTSDAEQTPVLPARARLRAVAHAGPACPDAAAACQAMGWPAVPGPIEVVQLAPRDNQDLGEAQQRSGFLAEASGIETLLRVLNQGREQALIEVRRGAQALAWLFVDRITQRALPDEPAARLPLVARFSQAAPLVPAVPTAEPTPCFDAASPALTAGRLGDILSRSLELRTRILARLLQLAPTEVAAPALVQRRDPINVLLRDIAPDTPRSDTLTSGTTAWCATVQVNEQHPYHFDHALDHVPGILLLEAALQISEVAVAASAQPHREVLRLGVRFRRYTDKHAPIALQAAFAQADVLQVVIQQLGERVCEIELGLGVAPPRAAQAVAPATAGLPDPKWLHKVRPENRLVHALEQRAGELGVVTAPLPATHALADSPSPHLSMLYFLEVARQCFMLVAHGPLGVPLGTPMNLIDLRFSLSAPIPREGALWLAPQFNPGEWQGRTRTSQVTIHLRDALGTLGEASIVSQAIAPQAYRAQRQAETA